MCQFRELPLQGRAASPGPGVEGQVLLLPQPFPSSLVSKLLTLASQLSASTDSGTEVS
jgi:hypothetical protein